MKTTIPVSLGTITLGGGNPIRIQSMTDTDTADGDATAQQILELARAGSEIVRITIDRHESAEAVPYIVEKVRKTSSVPIVGDFHFNGHILLQRYPKMASALDKYRINPGNVGKGKKKDEQFEQILALAQQHKKAIRIGGNGGSLDPEILMQKMDENHKRPHPKSEREVLEDALLESVLSSAEYATHFGIEKNKIVLSAKVSSPQSLLRIYRTLAKKTEFPLHLGLTEAGSGTSGIIYSTAAISPLLFEGIGDTIRISLTPKPSEARTKEVHIAQEVLQATGKRQFSIKIISCPGCGRTTGNRFQKFTENIRQKIQNSRLPNNITIAVMGCIVNGPGEAHSADIGIFFPGKGEGKRAIVSGKNIPQIALSGENIEEQFFDILTKTFSRAKKVSTKQHEEHPEGCAQE